MPSETAHCSMIADGDDGDDDDDGGGGDCAGRLHVYMARM